MNYVRQHMSPARIVVFGIVCLVTVVTLAKMSRANIGTVAKVDLSGPWQATLLMANSGCGPESALVNFTLNGSGVATNANLVIHGACGDSTITGQTFTISSLTPNGSGTASLSCGTGCGWGFNIQVASDRAVFNLVDVLSQNPNNFVQGTAIHQ